MPKILHLQCGLPKPVIEEFHIALFLFQFFLQLCNTGFQTALLIQQS